MRAVIQRVSRAKVSVENEIVGEIGKGILILLGISREDSEKEAQIILEKTLNLRIFDDADGKMNLSLLDMKGALLVVSQFTLYGDARRGRRPSFIEAAAPVKANALYEFFVSEARKQVLRVETGRFQAMMDVELVGDGPVTILLDSAKLFSLFNPKQFSNNFMSKKLLTLLLAAIILLSVSCKSESEKEKREKKLAETPVTKGVKPVADNEIAVIEMEQPAYGTIKIELYSNIAPKMVARFKELAKEGVYNGTTFHRINETVIQGGDPLSKDDNPKNDGSGNSDKPNVPAEFSDIPYDTAIVGAARMPDPNSANSQFFIMLRREPGFDQKYTVFGKVIEGMNNVRTISGVNPKEGERPLENVVVKSVTIQPKQ